MSKQVSCTPPMRPSRFHDQVCGTVSLTPRRTSAICDERAKLPRRTSVRLSSLAKRCCRSQRRRWHRFAKRACERDGMASCGCGRTRRKQRRMHTLCTTSHRIWFALSLFAPEVRVSDNSHVSFDVWVHANTRHLPISFA